MKVKEPKVVVFVVMDSHGAGSFSLLDFVDWVRLA